MNRPLTIIGGGLAGLGLANGLRLAGVPVEVLEAGRYPRHRVCGEFMSGLTGAVTAALGIGDCFHDALLHHSTCWFRGNRRIAAYRLPAPAAGISRYTLDARLAALLVERGGSLREGTPARAGGREGVIATSGRTHEKGGYFGFKGHWSGVATEADLELQLGRQAYIGLSRVEDGFVNVCGLFRSVAAGRFPTPLDRFHATLEAHQLGHLADRLPAATLRPGSLCSVSGLSYRLASRPPAPALGDQRRLIPPFTGNGMSLALEGAAAVLPLAVDYARGRTDWRQFRESSARLQRERFGWRHRCAGWLHPFLLSPPLQAALAGAARLRLLPFSHLYRFTHS